MLTSLTTELQRSVSLSPAKIADAVRALIEESVSVEAKAEFLTALAKKGETIEEIAGFARELRDRALRPPFELPATEELLDVCGTGGDRLNTFNISTTVALIVSSAGVRVAKHGNRAITSQSGSADVLESLNVPIDLTPDQAAKSLREHHFAFFFAPRYHPSFRHIVPARKLCAERGQRTVFNILGPLLNPARPTVQLVGVPAPDLCEPIGRVLQSLGARRGMVVCGQTAKGGLDELSILGENTIAEFYQDRAFTVSRTALEQFSLGPARLEDLAGGDREMNATTIRRLLKGDERGPKRDAVLLNAGAALFIAGRTKTVLDGWDLAAELIDSGKAARKLADLAESRPG